jgi:hypothetical protein
MFKLFGSKNLSSLTDGIRNQVESYINVKDENYLLSVNEENYINYLYEKHKIDKIYIDLEGKKISNYEKMTLDNRFPGGKRHFQVVAYHLPIKGNQALLDYKPYNRYIDHFPDVYVEGNNLVSLNRGRTGQTRSMESRL